MQQNDADKVFQRLELPASRVQEEMVFFDPAGGKYYATGSVGAAIWEHLTEPRSFAEICAYLLERYDVDPAVCEREVRAFFEQMIEAKMVGEVARP